MKPHLTGAVIGAMSLGWVTGAFGQDMACATRAEVIDRLARDYGETRQAVGLASASQMVEVFASDETGSWTITMTRPDGTTCLMAAGQHFERMEDNLVALGDPA